MRISSSSNGTKRVVGSGVRKPHWRKPSHFSGTSPARCFCSTAFCRCHFYFYGFLTDANLSAFLILYFTHRSFADLVLCHGGFQGPPDMGRFQRSRWTSDGHFSGRICTAGQRVKRPVWTRRTGGESTSAAADEGDGGLTNFSQHYIIFIATKSHIIWLAKRK